MKTVIAPARFIDHIGFSVPNLDQAIAFFDEILGAKLVMTRGPYECEDDWMKDHLNVHPRSVIRRMALMKMPTGSSLEIFQYESPGQKATGPANSDIGGHHIAFFVDDIHLAVKNLNKKGVKVLGEAKTFDEGPCKGQSWVYFMAPWGMQLELVSYPPGWPFDE